MLSLLAGTTAFYSASSLALNTDYGARACTSHMQVASWYDSGQRLNEVTAVPANNEAGEVLTDTVAVGVTLASAIGPLAGAVASAGANLVGEAMGKKAAPLGSDTAALLKRYLQLSNVLAATDAEVLDDATVLALIRKVEAEVNPVTFDRVKILGNWQLCWQRNAKQATRSQKALAPLPQYSNFITDDSGRKIFRNVVQLVRDRVKVIADVEYTLPEAEEPGRLGSTICAAGIELSVGRRFGWKPLRVPLRLRGVGWLDVTYLSDEMRITRGNRGGIFVHLRPPLLTRNAAEGA